MATYWEDFSSIAAGSGLPVGFTSRFATSNSFSVVSDASVLGGKYLEWTVTSTGRAFVSFDAVNGDAARDDVEVALLVRAVGGVPSQQTTVGAGARAAGGSGNESVYTVFSNSSEQFLRKYVTGSLTNLGTTTPGFDYSDPTWVRLRANGTTLRARFWLASASEPATWSFDTTDASITAAGWAGFFAFNADTYQIHAIGVGTAGDTAPTEEPSVGPVGPFLRTSGGYLRTASGIVRPA